MLGKIVSGVLSLAFFVVPCVCEAQIHERGMMRNRANVEIESSSYTIGIIKDTTKFKNSFIQFVNSTVEDPHNDVDKILFSLKKDFFPFV